MQCICTTSILSNFPGIQVMIDYKRSPNADQNMTAEKVIYNLRNWPLRRLLHKGTRDMDGVQAPRQIRALMFLLIYGIHDELSFLHLREFVTWHRHNIDQDASQMQTEMVDTQWITSFIISPTLTIAAAIKKKLIVNEEIKTNRAWLKVELCLSGEPIHWTPDNHARTSLKGCTLNVEMRLLGRMPAPPDRMHPQGTDERGTGGCVFPTRRRPCLGEVVMTPGVIVLEQHQRLAHARSASRSEALA